MRLDKFFSVTGLLTRSQCSKAARAGLITVDGTVIKDPSFSVVPEKNAVAYRGETVTYSQFIYIMMNKPSGYVCSNDEPNEKNVFELLGDRYARSDLFTVGRLDKDTTGLLIITNDGKTAHDVLSPRHHVDKTYEYTLAENLTEPDRVRLENGIKLKDGYMTKPCRIIPADPKSGRIILSEGKYHQIKRMFGAVSNRIETLERVSFGSLTLDGSLGYGQWRLLTDDEVSGLKNAKTEN